MLGLHNIISILEMFSKLCHILFLILYDFDRIFNWFKDWCNWVLTVLIIICNLFYPFNYTNFLILDMCLPIFYRILICSLFLSLIAPKLARICILHIVVILCLSHGPIFNFLFIYHFSTETSVGSISGVLGLILIKYKWFNYSIASFTLFRLLKFPWT